MQYCILGPLRVIGEHGQFDTWEPRQERLLAVLLLSANRRVDRRHLIDAVWDENPPATAVKQLQNTVAALRRRLPGRPIESDSRGYLLRVAEGKLDAQVFAKRLGTARTLHNACREAEAVEEARAALAMWAGPALAGCSGRVVEAGAARLDEERLATIVWCAELELNLGRHEQLLAELAEMAMMHPTHERLAGLHMLALYRSGRRADALRVYQRVRARLAEELGIDPGAGLRHLHGAILRDEVPGPPAL